MISDIILTVFLLVTSVLIVIFFFGKECRILLSRLSPVIVGILALLIVVCVVLILIKPVFFESLIFLSR